jgi:glyoxylase-like metal-dependent hydrolase (beta-lactamase superfamily II)
MRKSLSLLVALLLVLAAWLASRAQNAAGDPAGWTVVLPGVLRSPGAVAGYALVDGEQALLIDTPCPADGLSTHGVRKIDLVLLTHYHRDSCAALGALDRGTTVKAPVKAAEWLEPDRVRKYWEESIPLRGSRTAYLVVPEGFAGIDYSLADGKTLDWRGWTLTVVDTPGHALAHVAVVAQKKGRPRIAFCGGAFTRAGKLWSPYTTDWDHWTDAGLKPTADSLRKILAQEPDILCPAHGPVVLSGTDDALRQTIANVEGVAFLKSFERFTKKRLGNPPAYAFLAREQAESNGSKPWSRVSDHLWLTGNTYVLTSRDGRCLMFDPWDKRSADQFARLRADQGLGPLEVVMFSHAHFDHYDGIYHLPGRDTFEVWSLDVVARPIADPARWRAPFLDARPVKFDRTPKDGETLAWREYRFRFRHLPGQSAFTMGVEATIDGKRCFFTADNFFHQDMFSGSGGWMGLNRSFPPLYAQSARTVLDAAPEWVLAEHGGPFEFSAEDFRRRIAWADAAATAADALSPSGRHRHDWNPHRVHVEPLVHRARPGDTLKARLVVESGLARKERVKVRLEGRGVFPDQVMELDVSPEAAARRDFNLRLPEGLAAGRHVFVVCGIEGQTPEGADAFLAVDVER